MIYSGYRLIEDINLTVPGPDRVVRRTWRVRLFTLPWRPLAANRTEPTVLPDPSMYASGDMIIAHPETMRRIKDMLATQGKKANP